MALDQEKIKTYWKSPQNKAAIEQANKDNERQLFHAQLSLSRGDSNGYLKVFLDKVKAILNNEQKFQVFDKLLTFPLKSNALISKATDEWNKITSAQDRVIDYNFVEESTTVDFQAFLESISFGSIIDQGLFTKAKQCVNTVAIVDTPLIANPGGLTEPYVYFVETGKCHDMEVDYSGSIKYVMFVRGSEAEDNRQLIVIDDTYYRVFDISKDEDLSSVSESAHNLGYCPATLIWRDVINPDNTIRRYNSVLEIVDKMDRYVMADIFSQHMDLYASFVIMWRYLDACEAGKEGEEELDSEASYVGPGHLVEMTLPAGDNAKMGIPVGFVNAERTILDYNREKVRNLEVEIIKHLTGVDNEIQNEKAFNESQIRSQYETRHSVLSYWAENVQYVHQFLINTIAKLRYGDAFLSSTINYGTDYFLYDTITATSEYEEAKKAELPQYILEQRMQVIEQVLTRNSPNAKARIDILRELEPYPHMPFSLIDRTSPEFELKANFSHYISRFERENGSIIKFGSQTDFNKKIDTINNTLYDYVKESIDQAAARARRLQLGSGTSVRQSGQSSEVPISQEVA